LRIEQGHRKRSESWQNKLNFHQLADPSTPLDQHDFTMASRIPPLLEPYLSLPPEASLILLTNVLSTSTNWLVLRYLQSFLTPPARNPEAEDRKPEGTTVVLVSFLRDWAFWRDGARKMVSILFTEVKLRIMSSLGQF
jgi:hypothetical protein